MACHSTAEYPVLSALNPLFMPAKGLNGREQFKILRGVNDPTKAE